MQAQRSAARVHLFPLACAHTVRRGIRVLRVHEEHAPHWVEFLQRVGPSVVRSRAVLPSKGRARSSGCRRFAARPISLQAVEVSRMTRRPLRLYRTPRIGRRRCRSAQWLHVALIALAVHARMVRPRGGGKRHLHDPPLTLSHCSDLPGSSAPRSSWQETRSEGPVPVAYTAAAHRRGMSLADRSVWLSHSCLCSSRERVVRLPESLHYFCP